MKKTNLIILILLIAVISPLPAYAYLDPGTGSMVIQVLIASLAAVGVAVKSFWTQIKIFFSRLLNKKEKENENE